MNSATKNLENDHIHILRLIDVMENSTRIPEPNINHLETMIDLIKNFADGFHHAKEENLLFPLLSERGFSLKQGPVAVMLNEHTQGRDFVKGMVENLGLYKAGTKDALSMVYDNMNGYCNLLRNHISKENNILFRMADNVLDENDHRDLLNQFSRVENSNFCGGLLKDCIASIDNLSTIYCQ